MKNSIPDRHCFGFKQRDAETETVDPKFWECCFGVEANTQPPGIPQNSCSAEGSCHNCRMLRKMGRQIERELKIVEYLPMLRHQSQN
jgi:hypothetical protein